MSCESCYNGCVQTVSDECVRYTGLDNAPLDITYGDNLQSVLTNIINKLFPLLSGEGDKITIAEAIRCAIVDANLPVPVGANQWTSEQLFQTLVKVVCNLQTQITGIDATLATLNADYSLGCLSGVTASSDTHDIVQAIIVKLCATVSALTAFEISVDANYVKLADLDTLIAAYLASQSSSTQQYTKMVPYAVYEYYGPLTNFDGTGAGISNLGFYKVYLCNGLNGTPDKRGRVTVGAISGVPSSVPLDPSVDPTNAGNPNYALYGTTGQNTVTLTTNQLPSHTHTALATATSTVTDPGHFHYAGNQPNGWTSTGGTAALHTGTNNWQSSTATTGITVQTTVGVTNSNTGTGQAHANIQPVIAAYYIMYIP